MTKAKNPRPYWSVMESRSVGGKPAEREIGGGWVQADGSINVKMKTQPRGKYITLKPNPYWIPPATEGNSLVGDAEPQRESENLTDSKADVAEVTEKPRRVILKRRP